MKIAVVGTGYVGLVSGVCFADFGHEVTCIDHDEAKVALLESGKSPIYEPGLEELLERNIKAKRLHFTRDIASGVKDADVVFIAVGTPPDEQGQADLSQLKRAFAPVARAVRDDAVIVVKSTVPVGTTRGLATQMREFRPDSKVLLASNPEFLRQGDAIKDFMKPDRVVAGVDHARAGRIMNELYAPLSQAGIPLLLTTFESSEMIKYASNTMLAAKIAFINEMADICEHVGANIRDVARGVGLDHRIGSDFMNPGPGFGGSCFPKDTMALKAIADSSGVPISLLNSVITSNLARKDRMADKIANALGGSVKGRTVAILGLTFKPGTDDLRESVSIAVIETLKAAGAKLRAYDPQGMKQAKHYFEEGTFVYATDAYDAAFGAEACVILTEWNEFRSLDLARLKTVMQQPLLIDLRNIYKRRQVVDAGFRYLSIGRAEVSPERRETLDMVPLDAEEDAA